MFAGTVFGIVFARITSIELLRARIKTYEGFVNAGDAKFTDVSYLILKITYILTSGSIRQDTRYEYYMKVDCRFCNHNVTIIHYCAWQAPLLSLSPPSLPLFNVDEKRARPRFLCKSNNNRLRAWKARSVLTPNVMQRTGVPITIYIQSNLSRIHLHTA